MTPGGIDWEEKYGWEEKWKAAERQIKRVQGLLRRNNIADSWEIASQLLRAQEFEGKDLRQIIDQWSKMNRKQLIQLLHKEGIECELHRHENSLKIQDQQNQTYAQILKNNIIWEDSNREPQPQQQSQQIQTQTKQIRILQKEPPATTSSSKQKQRQQQTTTMPTSTKTNKQIAVEWNCANPDKFPLCEKCNQRAYVSNHATKPVCQVQRLNWCRKCFKTLRVLDEDEDRRECPNHTKCIAFTSKSDKRKWASSDFELDYFRDYTVCEEHPGIKLYGPEGLCEICDSENEAMQLKKDDDRSLLYGTAGQLVAQYMWKKYQGLDLEKRQEISGGALDAFYLPLTPLQLQDRERRRQWEKDEKEAKEEFQQILEGWIPQEYRWLKQQMMELEAEIVLRIMWERTKAEPVTGPLIICYGCRSIYEPHETRLHPRYGILCETCSSHGINYTLLFRDVEESVPQPRDGDFTPTPTLPPYQRTITPPPMEEQQQPMEIETTTIITPTQPPTTEVFTTVLNKRKKKSQGVRRRQKLRRNNSNNS